MLLRIKYLMDRLPKEVNAYKLKNENFEMTPP